MNQSIWLIGGTTESVALAKAIAAANLPQIITVTTENARKLYSPEFRLDVGCMGRGEMKYFCEQHQVAAIVDASHPYAVEVSQNAIAISLKSKIPYLRYERPEIKSSIDNNYVLDSFETLIRGNYLQGKRVLLTVGCKTLPLFKSCHDQIILFARILPRLESLKIALDSGFTSDRIIALRPPLTRELEAALWQQWQISLVVTKASGKAGGEDLKRQVARDLQIPLITISRPQVSYPQQTSCLARVLDFCQQYLS